MSSTHDQQSVCEALASGRYSACDVSDVLALLKVPQAGFLPNIMPIPMPRPPSSKPLVAPISTILFVPNSGPREHDPQESNIPANEHFTEIPPPGTIVVMQQPLGLLTAVLGDIMATRLLKRGIRGVVIDGRVRDIGPIGSICAANTTQSEDGSSAHFSVWSKGTSTVGPALQCKAWCADVVLKIGGSEVRPGDFLFVDETERGVVVLPQDRAEEVVTMLPAFKDKDDKRVADVEAGISLTETVKRNPWVYHLNALNDHHRGTIDLLGKQDDQLKNPMSQTYSTLVYYSSRDIISTPQSQSTFKIISLITEIIRPNHPPQSRLPHKPINIPPYAARYAHRLRPILIPRRDVNLTRLLVQNHNIPVRSAEGRWYRCQPVHNTWRSTRV